MSVIESSGGGLSGQPRCVTFVTRREVWDDGSCVVRSLGEGSQQNDGRWRESACKMLAAFARTLRCPAALRFSRIHSLRRVVDALDESRERRVDVFALTGWLMLADGRIMSVGWSGRGDGLARITAASGRELDALASAAGHSEPAPHGEIAVVLDHQPAAILAHEAIGHFAEGPAIPGMRLDHRLGCRLAPEWLTAQDNPRLDGAAHYCFDDEGVESTGPTELLKDGILSAQLHSTVSAARAGVLPTANARSSQAAQPAIPRLSNLVIGGGDAELDAMLDRMGDGLFVRHLSHGFSRGLHIEARLVLAERVKRGRRTGLFVSGGRIVETVDLLLRAREATRIVMLNPNAMCGKHVQVLYDVGTSRLRSV